MDTRFYESWFNSPHKVLGRKLHPFCFNDALILSAAESPFMLAAPVQLSAQEYAAELRFAVMVCSSGAERFFTGTMAPRSAAEWLRMTWWKFSTRKSPIEDEVRKFQEYLQDFNAGPEFWSDEEGARARTPWILANVTHLLRTTSLTEKEIWTMPMGKALWYSAAVAEQSGNSAVEILTDEEAQALKELGL